MAGEEATESEEAFTTFTLKGTHGYKAFVLAAASVNDGELETLAGVVISRKHSSVTIATPAKVTTAMVEGVLTVTEVDADFGSLGEISVQFRGAGRKRIARPRCASEAIPFPDGRYEGTIELHGEEGFTDISETSVAARPDAYLNLFCAAFEGGETVETIGDREPGAKLEVDTRAHPLSLSRVNPGVRQLNLTVQENRPGAPVRVRTEVTERRGRVSIARAVSEKASADAFAFTPDVSRARFSLGAPFAGRGVFQRGAKPRNRWHGNLTVDFPGRSNVHLTGPGLGATLVHAHYSVQPFSEERLLGPLRRLVVH